MLNKIKITGKVLGIKEKEIDREEQERNESILYFSLLVPNPSGSLTILRCLARGEKAEEIEREVKRDEIIEIKGYLRNEKSGRQILIKLVDFTKLDIIIDSEKELTQKIDIAHSNQVRLLGKIITDLNNKSIEGKSDVLSFRLAIPREKNLSPLFFCRVQGETLINEMRNKLQKGDIILLEGFLQTKKIEMDFGEESEKIVPRISSIICQSFVLIDNDSANNFKPLHLTRVEGETKVIDFTKPKKNLQYEETTE